MFGFTRGVANKAGRKPMKRHHSRLWLETLEDRTLLTSGFLSPTFFGGGRVLTDFTGPLDNPALAVARQADGKLVALGWASNGAHADLALVRYNVDGTLDVGFGTGGRVRGGFTVPATGAEPVSLMFQADGKILAAGLPKISATGPGVNLAVTRFNTDGTPDTGFGNSGKVLTEVTRQALRAPALTFQLDTRLTVAALLLADSQRVTALRYNPDGTRVATFADSGVARIPMPVNTTHTIAMTAEADGKTLFVATSLWFQQTFRLTSTGLLDPTYLNANWSGSGYEVGPSAVTIQPDGSPIHVGSFHGDFVTARLVPSGAGFDGRFGGFGVGGQSGLSIVDMGGTDRARSVLVQPDGKLVLAGVSLLIQGPPTSRFALLRLNVDGRPDPTFGSGGKVFTEFGPATNEANAVLLQPDGKLVAAGATTGTANDFALARFNATGTLDTAFGTGGKATTDFTGALQNVARGVAMQPDNRILVAGTVFFGMSSDFALVRHVATGSLDTGFGDGGRVTTRFDTASRANAVIVQPDGKIVAAGTGGPGFAFARYLADGRLDDTFGTGGKVTFGFPIGLIGGTAVAFALALQTDGKIVAAGGCGQNPVLARLNPDGTLDTTFGTGGKVGDCNTSTNLAVQETRLALQADGKIITAVGYGSTGRNLELRRYNADGTPDTGFGTAGLIAPNVRSDQGVGGVGLRLQPDGKILVAGTEVLANIAPNTPGLALAVVRYNADGSLDAGFGASGKAVIDRGQRDVATDVILQTDDAIVIVGAFEDAGSRGGLVMVRLKPDGRLNTSFGTLGQLTVAALSPANPAAQAVQQLTSPLIVIGTVPGEATSNDFFVACITLAETFTSQNQQYVNVLYQHLLGRPADSGGLAAFTGALDLGTHTRAQIAEIIMGSTEYRTLLVRNLYLTLLGRTADAGGEAAFVGFLNSGGTVAQVKAALLGSDEYFQKNGSTNASFVTALYRDVLGRAPDAGGQQAYTQQLTAGVPRGTVATSIVTSRESLERIVQGWYQQYLRRGADPGGLDGYADFLQAGGREETAQASIFSSAEFAAAL